MTKLEYKNNGKSISYYDFLDICYKNFGKGQVICKNEKHTENMWLEFKFYKICQK